MTNLNETLQQAVACHQTGQYAEAEQLYRVILQTQPDHPDANHNLGILLGMTDGLCYLKAALEADPARGQFWLSYADALLASGQANEALLVMQTAMECGLDSPAARTLLQEAGIAASGGSMTDVAGMSDRDARPQEKTDGVSGAELPKTEKSAVNKGKPAKKSVAKPARPQASLSQAEINQLVALFNAGRYAELESRARVLVERYPDSGFVWKVLGVSLGAQGKVVLQVLQKATELLPADAETHYNLGNALRDLGQLDDAVASYRRALKIKPDYAEAHNNLGGVLKDQGNMDAAAESFRNALNINPKFAVAYCNLAGVLQAKGLPDEAMANLRQAVTINPQFALAHNNLGCALKELGQFDDAVASYHRALEIKPDYAEAHNNLGSALKALGQLDDAVACYRRALQIKPDYAEAHYNLGVALQAFGLLDDAVACYRRALEIKPDFAEAYSILGGALEELGRLDDAVASCRRALEIKPGFAEAHNNLGVALKDLGQLDDAVASYHRALEIKPDYAEAHSNLGVALQDLGQIDDAVACYHRALEIRSDIADVKSNLLFCLNYHADLSAEEIYRAYREHDALYGLPLRSTWRPHTNDKTPNRRLRIGYVSPDFRIHSCRSFLEPLLSRHDKTQVEVYAYAELDKEDELTARYRSYVEHWIPTKGLGDEALAERIRSDGIDILVDLAGHTRDNRLSVFARKPAPVSLSTLGFGYTTGLSAIDYFMIDAAAIPEGSEGLFAEQPWRLATPGFIYQPAAGMGEVSSLPALQRGYITFGTLTRSIRINHRTIRVWSEILKQVEGSRLVIDSSNFKAPAMQDDLAAKFAAHGIARERLELGYHSPPWDVLRGIDIGLDCFPHNSGATLFESLYLGVPFITLAGRPSVGRLGSSILQAAGHPEWIAGSEEDYVARAVSLAGDPKRLAAHRAALRGEMESSAMFDEADFVRKTEEAYRQMWQRWCAGLSSMAAA